MENKKTYSNEVLNEVAAFATPLLKNNSLFYYELTSKAVEKSQQLVKEIDLSLEEKEVIIIISWLLYIHYISKDEDIVKDFLSSKNDIQTPLILESIENILLEKAPKSNIDKILCDIHYSHLADIDFLNQNELFREELKNTSEIYSDIEWYAKTQKTFVKHRFYTEYGQRKFDQLKEENYQKIVKFNKKLQKMQDAELEKELKLDAAELKDLKKKLSKIENRPERGVETLYRLASKNLYTRLTMVDNKGNILISINAIIISLTIGSVMARLEEDPHLLLPIILLLTTNLGSILFAILATRPPKTKGIFNPDQITSESANLLSFDNFFNMKRVDYHKNMDLIANNADSLYSNITEDIYTMGLRLGKKYRFLRISYNVFLFGLILAVSVFLLCHILFEI